jgi:hypothetical protein
MSPEWATSTLTSVVYASFRTCLCRVHPCCRDLAGFAVVDDDACCGRQEVVLVRGMQGGLVDFWVVRSFLMGEVA